MLPCPLLRCYVNITSVMPQCHVQKRTEPGGRGRSRGQQQLKLSAPMGELGEEPFQWGARR